MPLLSGARIQTGMIPRQNPAIMNSMQKVIYLSDARTPLSVPSAPDGQQALEHPFLDTRGRPLRDLRISVTDRCNFRCTYCMPREAFGPDHSFLPHASLLSFEEITRLASVFVAQGVRKIRLTGGEPLLRKSVETLVGMLSELRTPEGDPLDLTLTTNGSLLARKAQALKDAGLGRITVSLDALEPELFTKLSDSKTSIDEVLRGIDTAAQVGLAPVKINVVVRRGINHHQILPIARRFRGTGHIVRFIEYMDVGNTNGWQSDEVVSGAEVLSAIGSAFPLEPLPGAYPGEVAERWRYVDGAGEIGVITSISQAFCSDCNRARLSPEGQLYLCLFADRGYDLRQLVRSNATDVQIASAVGAIWAGRRDAYSEQRGAGQERPRIEMSYIGG